MKIRPVGPELFHAARRTDERTDVTKLIVAFRNFANAPKKCHTMRHCNSNLESVRNTQATKCTI